MQIIITGSQGANLRTKPDFGNNVVTVLPKGKVVESDPPRRNFMMK